MSLSNSRVWSALCALLLVLILGGCQERTVPADTLRAAVPALPPSWGDPFKAEGTPSSYTWAAIFDGLVALNAEGSLAPALATSWSSPDGKTWQFKLRQNARFANGAPFNAAAAKATFDWLLSPDGKGTVIGGRLRNVAAVEAPADDLLVIRLKRPDAVFPKRLPSVAIVEPGQWARLGPNGFAKQPVGTGPYLLRDFDERQRRAHLDANPYAWRKPNIAKLEIVELGDEAVRQQALISGDIDIGRVGIDEIDYMTARGIRLERGPSMQVMSVAFVTEGKDGPLDDVRVRRALNMAVDRNALSKALLRGFGAPASQPGPAGTVGHDPNLAALPYDPAGARKLLTQAGYPSGFSMNIDVVVGSLPADALIYQAMARYLADVGVTVELRAIPFPVFLRNFLGNAWDADAFGLSWNSSPGNDIQRPLEIFSCLRKPKPFFCDPVLAKGISAAEKELDPARREAMLHQLAAAHRDAGAALYLVEQIDLIGLGNRIRGPVAIANRVPVYETISIDR
jgi:peptide/nickel transport system substrate-binding protein